MQIEEIKKINQEMEEYLFEKYNVEGYDEKLDEIFTRYLSICKNVNFSKWIPYVVPELYKGGSYK